MAARTFCNQLKAIDMGALWSCDHTTCDIYTVTGLYTRVRYPTVDTALLANPFTHVHVLVLLSSHTTIPRRRHIQCSAYWWASRDKRWLYLTGDRQTVLTFHYVPSYTVLAVQKSARTKPTKSIFIMDLPHVIEKEFKREQQRVLNIRK